MRSRTNVSFLVRGAIVALLAIAAFSGAAGFGPAEPSAEAAFMAEVKKLLASDGEASDRFGYSVAVDGDTAVVGAYREDAGGDDAGAVYVFQRDEGGADNWGEVKKLFASEPEPSHFGESVAIDADTVVAGAEGSAYVFERDEGGADNWGEVKQIDNFFFGHSVAVSGDIALVGAPGEDAGATAVGATYAFGRDEGGVDNWGEVKKLTITPIPNSFFGSSLSIDGDTAVIGAPRYSSKGTAFVFQRDEGGANNWGEVVRLWAPNIDNWDFLGVAVAVEGDTAVVGAYGDDDGGGSAGAAYVFDRDEGGADAWGQVKKLTASDPLGAELFGEYVAVSGDAAVVGAQQDGIAVGLQLGAAYVFERDEGGVDNWGEVEKLVGSDSEHQDFFGSVAMNGKIAVVGARGEDTGGAGAGAAYVFELGSPGDSDQDGCTDKAENGPDENVGGQRDNDYFWDFYDVWTHPPGDPIGWERNKVLNIFDINAVGARFGPGPLLSKTDALAQALVPPTDATGYHPAYDRGPIIGANNWDRGPADGSINIVDDILGVAQQFGHSCA